MASFSPEFCCLGGNLKHTTFTMAVNSPLGEYLGTIVKTGPWLVESSVPLWVVWRTGFDSSGCNVARGQCTWTGRCYCHCNCCCGVVGVWLATEIIIHVSAKTAVWTISPWWPGRLPASLRPSRKPCTSGSMDPPLNRKIVKFQLPYIWDEVLLNAPALSLK